MSKKYLATALIFLVAISAALFLLSPFQNNSRKKIDLIVTAIGFNPVFYPIENKKVPMPDGIDIVLRPASYSQAELYTLSSPARPFIGILSSINLALARSKGLKFKILVPYYREIVGPDGQSMGQIVVTKNSAIKTPQDLYGKRVAVQGESDGSTIAFKTVLRKKYNLDLNKIHFLAIENALMPILLKKGDIDAAMFDSNYILSKNFSENFETLIDFGRDLQDLYGTVPPVKFFVVKESLYDADPSLYTKTIAFFRENYAWSKQHMDMICQLEAEKTGESISFLLKKSQYESRLDTLTANDLNVFQDFFETAYLEGILEQRISPSEIFSP
jgi:ABC-type nitrate/sulfonate/bicarbonate transport system substrate-binding protein